jgi:flagellum-specific ATP synthase
MSPSLDTAFGACLRALEDLDPIRETGKVIRLAGPLVESSGPRAAVGEICPIHSGPERPPILAEVVGFRGHRQLLMGYDSMEGLGLGAEVRASGKPLTAPTGPGLIGRVLDGLGEPIDGRGPLREVERRSVTAGAPHPLRRQRISQPLATGVRAIDAFLTLGRGQRAGIFAGSGVGKSVLLGTIARRTEADVSVVALVGERGREVKDFLERDLTEEGLRRSVVVVATAEQPALLRVKTAQVATRIAEGFRDQGRHVLLLMDSLTRVAMAQREIGLLVGEPPTTKGYTPSVFSLLPQLLERAGTDRQGSITGLYTVLVEGDDLNDPIADAARATLDGHIVLSRALANRNHYPAVDVLESVSRLLVDVAAPDHLRAQAQVREWLSAYRDSEDLIQLGAYVRGTNATVDEAMDRHPEIERFLRQPSGEGTAYPETVRWLCDLTTGREAGAENTPPSAQREGARDEAFPVPPRRALAGAQAAAPGPGGRAGEGPAGAPARPAVPGGSRTPAA